MIRLVVNILLITSMLVSTVVAGNPMLKCFLSGKQFECAKKTAIIAKPSPKCGSCQRVPTGCQITQVQIEEKSSATCQITTDLAIKEKCSCSPLLVVQSAYLKEIKINQPVKTIARKFAIPYTSKQIDLHKSVLNTSNPAGIHNTIKSTVLLI